VPLVIGHKGSAEGVAPGSLEAYEAALAAGVEMVEVDVRRARDGELLVLHDPHVRGVAIASLAGADVRAAVGEPVVSLDAVVEIVARAGRSLLLDVKDVGGEVETVDSVLARLPADRLVVSSFEDVSVARLRRERPHLEVGLSIGREWRRPVVRTRLSELFPAARARACGARFLSVNRRLAPFGALHRSARLGTGVYVWTVDDEDELRRRLRDERLLGVVTNRPRRALELQAELDR
jgi:glycerophosphoryl diester phosphodiesterase